MNKTMLTWLERIANVLSTTTGAMATALAIGGMIMLSALLDREASAQSSLAPEAEERIRTVLHATRITSVRESVIPGVYEVVAGKNVLYTDPSARYLMVGHIYDLHTATDLTARRKAEVAAKTRRIPWGSWPARAAVRYGQGDLRLAILSDPQCGWCRKLHESLADAEDLEITEILYPRLPGAMEIAARILCTPDQAAALRDHFQGRTVPTLSGGCLDKAIADLEAALQYGERIGVQGTPLLIAPNGATHAGYLEPQALRRWLERNQISQEEAS